MSLTDDQIRAVAHLARLALPEEQLSDYADKLSGILDFVEQMKQADTSGVTPMSHPLDITQPTRSDTITETNVRERMQTLAPQVENGLYLVPKVIE